MLWIWTPLLLTLMGCGSFQKMALRSSTPVFEKSSQGMMREANWDFFRASTPSNLKLMELIWEQDKDNLRLLSLLVKGYAGYAFAVHETLALEDELAGVEDSLSKRDAIIFYTRALDYGLLYLRKKEISHKLLLSNDQEKLAKKLKELREEDATAVLYTAQAWGSLINLQKDNVALVAQVPKVKDLFDRVCALRPDIDQNVCDIFYAQYEASRPKMLGGDPERGEVLFKEAIAKHPMNLLIRMSYIQYSLIPMMDGEKYEREAAALREEFTKWEDLTRDNLQNLSPYRYSADLNLYNSVSKKRFMIVEKHKAKIF